MHFCPKGPAICKISKPIILKWGNSKSEKFSYYLISKEIYISFKPYTCLMNSFESIHCFLPNSQKGTFLSVVIHSSNTSTWKWLYVHNRHFSQASQQPLFYAEKLEKSLFLAFEIESDTAFTTKVKLS